MENVSGSQGVDRPHSRDRDRKDSLARRDGDRSTPPRDRGKFHRESQKLTGDHVARASPGERRRGDDKCASAKEGVDGWPPAPGIEHDRESQLHGLLEDG